MKVQPIKIWTHGKISLYLNEKPSILTVPLETMEKTYTQLHDKIKKEGKIRFGLDHIPKKIIEKYPILGKLNLLNVGTINEVELINNEIWIKEAEITNPLIQDLYKKKELPEVSIVGNAITSEIENNQYLLENLDIQRVDFVEEGACRTCKVYNQTNQAEPVSARLHQKNIVRTKKMTEKEQNYDFENEEFLNGLSKIISGKLKDLKEEILKELKTEEIDNKEDLATAKYTELEKELNKVKHERKIEAANSTITAYIQAGKILPTQKESYMKLAVNDLEGFNELMATMPDMVDLQKKAKASQPTKDDNGELDPADFVIEQFSKK